MTLYVDVKAMIGQNKSQILIIRAIMARNELNIGLTWMDLCIIAGPFLI